MKRNFEHLPGHWVICDRCEGHGYVLNPNIGEHAYGREEFDEAFPDDEDGPFNPRAEYFKRGGIYDVACPECNGGRVWAVDVSRCSFAEKRKLAEARRSKRWEAEWAAERRREAYMLGESGEY